MYYTKLKERFILKQDFISLKNDFAFKYTMQNKKVLRGFLAAVLKIDPEIITDIIFPDTHLDKEAQEDKQGILDVRVTINGNRQLNIELQVEYFKHWVDRTLFYNFKMFTDQGRKGSEYDNFTPCIHIGILGFNSNELNKKFYSRYQIQDIETHQVYSDKISFHVIQLKQMKNVPKEDWDELYYWAALMAAESQEECEMTAKGNEYLEEAVRETEKINRDADLRYRYLRRQIAIMDEATQKKSYYEDGVEAGKKEGIETGLEIGTDKMSQLIKRLAQNNEIEKIIEIADNISLREELFKKYNIE